VFSLSQLNRLSQAAWKRILLFGHAELKRPFILQLFLAVCDFLSTDLTYLQRIVFLALGPQRSLSVLYYRSLLFYVFFYYCFIKVSFFATMCYLFTIMMSQLVPADGTPGSGLASFAVK